MPISIKTLLDKNVLIANCQQLSSPQLFALKENLDELILERRQGSEERILKQKGKRNLNEMMGLMAKAGVSMDEFQAALNKLGD